MSLLSKFFTHEVSKEYFITLGVEEHHIRAAIASVSGNEVSVIGYGESEYSTGENETEAADIAISTAEKKLGEETTLIQKVVFALPLFYLEHDKVKPEYLTRLKKITKELDLKPSGFIEYPQALSFFLEKEEGSPPTLILLSVGKTHLTISLVRVGKIQQNLTLSRSESILTDIENILPNLQAEILPSRILLYDESENLEKIREELLRFPWHKHNSFLHTPKIEILSNQKILTALVEAAGSSLIPLQKQVKELQMEGVKEDIQEKIEEEKPIEQISIEEEKEMAKEPVKDDKTVEEKEVDFGFVEVSEKHHHNIRHPKHPPILISEEEEKEEKVVVNKTQFKMPKFSFAFPGIPSFSLDLFLFTLGMILVILSLFTAVWFYPKTNVSLIVYPQIYSTQTDVTLTTNSSDVKPDKNIILATQLSEEISGQKAKETTGTTNVGEKARGDLTIYNKTLSAKTIPKGSVLQNGELRFTLDEDIQIASASDTGEGLTFGKVNAKITASVIGPESNLTGGTNLVFKDFPDSSYTSKTLTGLSGGTSREVSSISKEDQNNLETALKDELLSQIKQKLILKIQQGEKLLDGSFNTTVVTKKYSGEVGSEAKEVSLSMTIKVNAFSFREDQLSNLATQTITNLPSGFTLDKNRTGIKIDQIKTDAKTNIITARATVMANFWPELDMNNIKNNLIGKNYEQAVTFLQTIEHVGGVRITTVNELPIIKNLLPLSTDNLLLTIVSI